MALAEGTTFINENGEASNKPTDPTKLGGNQKAQGHEEKPIIDHEVQKGKYTGGEKDMGKIKDELFGREHKEEVKKKEEKPDDKEKDTSDNEKKGEEGKEQKDESEKKEDKLLTDLFPGMEGVEEFKGKTFKDFANIVKTVESDLAEFKKDRKDKLEAKDKAEAEEKQAKEEKSKPNRDDYVSEEEYQTAKKLYDQAKEIKELKEHNKREDGEKLKNKINKNIEETVLKHKVKDGESLVTQEDINNALSISAATQKIEEVDIGKILDKIVGSRKKIVEKAIEAALEEAKPKIIKEFLAMKKEDRQKFVEAKGGEPPSKKAEEKVDNTFETAKSKTKQFVKELLGKT